MKKEEKEHTLRVTGFASIASAPDIAKVQTGVTTDAKTAREALTMNNVAFSAIRKLLQRQNVAEKDLETLDFEVREQFERLRNGRRGNFTGYRVTNDLEITVRNLDLLSELLDSLVTAGSNRIQGIEFSVENPEPLIDQSRGDAIADAQENAALYAEYAGVKVGRLITISEQRLRQPRVRTSRFRGGDGGLGGAGTLEGFGSTGGKTAASASGGVVDSSVRVSAVYAITN